MDFTVPAVSQNYASGYTASIIQNQKDLGKWLDSVDIPSPTGLIAGIKRYNATNQIFERRNAGNTAWEELPLAYAKLASPTFTGTPSAPTAAQDTTGTQLATLDFVLNQAGTASPLINGTVAVGTSKRYARQDHVHPTDTTRAPLADPVFTGTPKVGANNIWHAGTFNPSLYAPLANPTFTGTLNAATVVVSTAFSKAATVGIFSGGGVWTGNSTSYYMYSYGNIYAVQEVYAWYSDERLKTRMGNIENALEKVRSLDGFMYVQNDLGNKLMGRSDKVRSAVSAQQVQRVDPSAVGLAPFDLDHNTGKSKSGQNYLTVNYERLIPLLIEAVKELSLKVEARL